MANNKEKDLKSKKKRKKHDPEDVVEDYELTDEELAAELGLEDIEQDETDIDDPRINRNTFDPFENDEELAEELADADIEEDDELGEGDLDTSGANPNNLFTPSDVDEEIGEELADADVEQDELAEEDIDATETTAEDLFTPSEDDEELAEELASDRKRNKKQTDKDNQ